MGKVRITTISDTHTKHMELNGYLPGGDILIHAGDISNRGSNVDINEFCEWFESIDNYNTKIFIAGNHDFGFQIRAEEVSQIINSYKWINYLDGIYLEKFPCYLEQNFKLPIRKFYGIKIGNESLYTVSHRELQDNEFQLVLSKGK